MSASNKREITIGMQMHESSKTFRKFDSKGLLAHTLKLPEEIPGRCSRKLLGLLATGLMSDPAELFSEEDNVAEPAFSDRPLLLTGKLPSACCFSSLSFLREGADSEIFFKLSSKVPASVPNWETAGSKNLLLLCVLLGP